MWTDAARGLAASFELSVANSARMFAMMYLTSADSAIGCWDAKYTYKFWRPVTAIRAGGGNPSLVADPAWSSLVLTPAHPEYPSAHNCLTGANTYALAAFFHTDDVHFTVTSNTLPSSRAFHTSPMRGRR
jgi:hypothetical protein